jgi:hypothetical protein
VRIDWKVTAVALAKLLRPELIIPPLRTQRWRTGAFTAPRQSYLDFCVLFRLCLDKIDALGCRRKAGAMTAEKGRETVETVETVETESSGV